MSDAADVHDLAEAFFTVTKVPHDPLTKAFLDRCQSHTIKIDAGFYKYYRCGSGPTVLLVHGIHSNLGSMTAIAEDLLQHGFQVVLFDAPAHGETLGATTDPYEVRELIRALYAVLGEGLHAVVAHSLGGLWALSAWAPHVAAKALVCISSPSDQEFVVAKFAELNGAGEEAFGELVAEIERRLGPGVWTELSPSTTVKTLDIPGLVIHGAGDDYVPPVQAEELHSGWRDSTLELIEGAGHFDIVGAPRVRQVILQFLQGIE